MAYRVRVGEPVLIFKPGLAWGGNWVKGIVKEIEGECLIVKLCGTPYSFAVHHDAYPTKWKRDTTIWSTGKHTKNKVKNRNLQLQKQEKAYQRRRFLEEERRMIARYAASSGIKSSDEEEVPTEEGGVSEAPKQTTPPPPRNVVIKCANSLYFWMNEKPKKRTRGERRMASRGLQPSGGDTNNHANVHSMYEQVEEKLTPEEELRRALFGGLLLRPIVDNDYSESEDEMSWGGDAADWADEAADSGRPNWGNITKGTNKQNKAPKKDKKKKEKKPKRKETEIEEHEEAEWGEEPVMEEAPMETAIENSNGGSSYDPFYTPPVGGAFLGSNPSSGASYDIQGYSFIDSSVSFSLPSTATASSASYSLTYSVVDLASCSYSFVDTSSSSSSPHSSYSFSADASQTSASTSSNPYSININDQVFEEVKNFSCVPSSFSTATTAIDSSDTLHKDIRDVLPDRDSVSVRIADYGVVRAVLEEATPTVSSGYGPWMAPTDLYNTVKEQAEEIEEEEDVGGELFAGLFAATTKNDKSNNKTKPARTNSVAKTAKPTPATKASSAVGKKDKATTVSKKEAPSVKTVKPKPPKPTPAVSVASASPTVLVVTAPKKAAKKASNPEGKTNKQLKREAKWDQRKEKREAFKQQQRLLKQQQQQIAGQA